MSKKNFVVFSPGARGNFLECFLNNKLTESFEYVSGDYHCHTWQLKIKGNNFIVYETKDKINKQWPYNETTNIFIDLDKQKLDTWLNLFYEKKYKKNLLEENTFDKLFASTYNELKHCRLINRDHFDYIVPFSKLYDWDYMENLFFNINGHNPTCKEVFLKTNEINNLTKINFKVIVEMAQNYDPEKILTYKLFDEYREKVV